MNSSDSGAHLVSRWLSHKLLLCGSQVVRCCLEHAASVANSFLTSDAVVTDIKEPEPIAAGNPMDNSGFNKFQSQSTEIFNRSVTYHCAP